ncbi:MAG: DUF523 domain-containing protein [Candidatus Aenigmarchaeota archaeon]|nr:DUF523 domain-containing protein [Candidatus Aenigmarchaeota archaeon]
MKLCSACLVGIKCAYDGKDRFDGKAKDLFDKGQVIPVCPEQLGGLPTPREKREVRGGDGRRVLEGKAGVIDIKGRDMTKEAIRGAEETLRIARQLGVKGFIGKARSPSCGCGKIYDGTFSGRLVKGDGVTVAMLKKNGMKAITEEDL